MSHAIEGMWEEVLQPGEELPGHRVEVIVFDQKTKTQFVAEAIQGRIGQLSFDVLSDIHEKTGEMFSDIVAEKHRTISEAFQKTPSYQGDAGNYDDFK